MNLFGPIAFVGSLALIAVTGLVIIISSTRREPDPATDHLRRRSTIFTLLAAAAAVAAIVALPTMRYGLDRALAPLVAGIAMTLVIVVHEITWPRPAGHVRSASLHRRTLLGTAPRWLTLTTASAVALLWLVDLASVPAADPSGRGLTRAVGDDMTFSHGPFPGAFYAVPTLSLSLVLLAATAGGLWVIANRSGLGGDERDAAYRRLSAHRALRGAAFGHLATLTGHAGFAGSALRHLYPHSVWSLLGVGLYVIAGAAFLASLVVMFVASHALIGLPASKPSPVVPSH